jgi:drug/metabolite transporter (DMT)-like permease
MFVLALLLLFVAISLGASGQILMKGGLRQLGERPAPAVVLRALVSNWLVLSGFACYGVSSILYLLAISRLDVSYAYPMVALSYVMVAVVAWRLFDESIPPLRVVGLVVIMLGVLLMALSRVRETPTDQGAGQAAAIQTEVSRE